MKNAKLKNQEKPNRPTRIKFVKKANMWCKTEWKDGKQHMEWSKDKPLLRTN